MFKYCRVIIEYFCGNWFVWYSIFEKSTEKEAVLKLWILCNISWQHAVPQVLVAILLKMRSLFRCCCFCCSFVTKFFINLFIWGFAGYYILQVMSQVLFSPHNAPTLYYIFFFLMSILFSFSLFMISFPLCSIMSNIINTQQ